MDQAKRHAKLDAKKRAIDEEKFIRDRAKRWTKSNAKQRAIDEDKVKKDQTERKRLSRNKRKLENPVKLSEMELLAQIKKKKHWNEKDRLREFRHGTKYSCLFICNCRHRRIFHENVEVITEKTNK